MFFLPRFSIDSTFKNFQFSFAELAKKPKLIPRGNTFDSRSEGLKFKSRAGQIGYSVANGSPPLQRFERSCVA